MKYNKCGSVKNLTTATCNKYSQCKKGKQEAASAHKNIIIWTVAVEEAVKEHHWYKEFIVTITMEIIGMALIPPVKWKWNRFETLMIRPK